MTWLFWNIRGVNKGYKQKELKQYLKENHIKLTAFLETRVKENNAQCIASKVVPKWQIHSNYRDAKKAEYGWFEIKRCIRFRCLKRQLNYFTAKSLASRME